MEIHKRNKLIAEFMGYERYPIKDKSDGYKVILKKGFIPLETCIASLQFDYSWEWLMPVVEKIRSQFNFHVSNYFDNLTINITGILSNKCSIQVKGEGIDAYYKAVVEFIEWYNENKL